MSIEIRSIGAAKEGEMPRTDDFNKELFKRPWDNPDRKESGVFVAASEVVNFLAQLTPEEQELENEREEFRRQLLLSSWKREIQ